MVRIAAVLPFEELRTKYEETFREHNTTSYERSYNADEYEMLFYSRSQDLSSINLDADVIIARGMTAYELRRLYNDTPVIEIPIVGSDIIRCLYTFRGQLRGLKAAIIGSSNMNLGAEGLAEIFQMELKPVIVDSHDLLEAAVYATVRDGYTNIIGGPDVCMWAEASGCRTAMIMSGKETIWNAITEAKRAALLGRKEQEKTLRVETILDYAHEGIVAVDNDMKITVFNHMSRQTLKPGEEKIIGQNISRIIGDRPFEKLLQTEKTELDKIINYKGINLACNKVPMFLRGEKVGSVVTFKDITSILETEKIIRKKVYLKGHVAKHTFNDIIGQSAAMLETISKAKTFSEVHSNILLKGETGTGKEIFAQSIHNFSSRKHGPFVAINCAALPEELLESELFGYTEGAFTGASKGGKIGLFELAHNGTIFLDEISEISYKLQGRLLRVIQEREIMRLGSDKVTPIDVRVLCATNKDLQEQVTQNKFREDLLYRIDVLEITLPPLRERRDDIPGLLDNIMTGLCKQFGCGEICISESAKNVLKSLPWPGNVRQLINICERLSVLCKNSTINEADVYNVIPGLKPETAPAATQETEQIATSVKSFERRHIIDVLEKCRGNRKDASSALGVSRSTLWRRMRELNISA